MTVRPGHPVGAIDRRLFGSFVEHLGRAVYDGLFEPGHPAADEDGFRRDVLELVRELGVTTVRYPGGNFVSSYRWEDGVGPRASRPRRLDPAWHSIETNQIGIDEFARWTAKAGAELMLAVNLGTRGVAEALDVLEYCNIPGGTALSDARASHGSVEPHDVRLWCLGNEMDGPWQIGHRSAEEYGTLAAQTARAMRQVDNRVLLVACGSSGRGMPTFGEWERTVLDRTWGEVDYISCHAYYQEKDGDLASFLASSVDMDRFIEAVAEAIDDVAARRGGIEREVSISFDEWNVWDVERFDALEKRTAIDDWPVAPRILEDSYSVSDAVVVGSLLMSLLRHADRVKAASLAQLVNVIAPIMTEPGGIAWRQTSFYPFAITARLARGETIEVYADAPTYEHPEHGSVSLVDAVATADAGGVSLFLVNRSTDAPAEVTVDLSALGVVALGEAVTLSDADPYARNTLADPNRVVPRTLTSARIIGRSLVVTLDPVSWSAIRLVKD